MGKLYTAIGLMSGTSMDGIDASIISSDGDREYSIIVDKYYKYDEKFRDNLVHIRSKILTNEDLTSFENEIETLERELTFLHAKAAKDIVEKNDLNIDFIGFHGHTLFHDSRKKISKQIGDGNLLSQLCKKDVIYNFRQVDIENGGEEQIDDEISAYKSLIPDGQELVATVMIEIDSPIKRAEFLAKMGGFEEQISIEVGDRLIKGRAELDGDRTTADGKASSVQFVHFEFDDESVKSIKNNMN